MQQTGVREASQPAGAKRNFERQGTNLVPVLDRLKRRRLLGRGNSIGTGGQTPGFLYEVEVDSAGRILAGKRVDESELGGHIHFLTIECEEKMSDDHFRLTSLAVVTEGGICLYRRSLH
jgi:hypothetical protein